ncbi:TPA: hypothetical protein ACGUPM_002651 [Vibrio vulnificus]
MTWTQRITELIAAVNNVMGVIDGKLRGKADKLTTYTKAETDARIEQVIGTAPDVLDTLQELAEALGNDPNFAATVTNQLALKANKTEVYSRTDAEAAFLAVGASATNAQKLGNNLPSHYATAAAVYTLEQELASGFTQLAQAFNDGANRINNIGA